MRKIKKPIKYVKVKPKHKGDKKVANLLTWYINWKLNKYFTTNRINRLFDKYRIKVRGKWDSKV